MKVRDVMTSPVLSVEPDTTILQAVRMLQRRISGLPVVDKDGRLAGIVTEGDFCGAPKLGHSVGGPAGWNTSSGPGDLPTNTRAPMAARSARS